jgi:predicted regulator of Ras-like GTPase activity (Roadblock/LC7/MglB family)
VESELDRLRQKVENFPSPSTYTRLAELLRAKGEMDAAVGTCQRCIKEFPRTGQAYVILAEIDLSAGRKDEGIKKLLTAVERDPRSYAAHRLLADHFCTTGQIPQALMHLRQILTFKSNDPEVLKRIADLAPKGTAPGATSEAKPAAGLSGKRPAVVVPSAKPVPQGLGPLVAETGVRGALIADAHGRVVSSAGFTPAQEDTIAALAAEFGRDTATAMESAGQGKLMQWMLAANQGQVMAFKRDNACSVVVLAESGVRPALLEIRARQALAELGAV